MPRIAPHCQPDGWRGRSNPYTPEAAWPEDTYVQWGSKGVVLSAKGNYVTAFFEAFPRDPDTFIRGQGQTIAQAEAAAFAKFQAYRSCPGHEFERGKYTNGAGICKHCGLFKSKAFEPLTRCHVCDAPTDWDCGHAGGNTYWYCQEHAHLRRPNGHLNMLDKWDDEEAAEREREQAARESAQAGFIAPLQTAQGPIEQAACDEQARRVRLMTLSDTYWTDAGNAQLSVGGQHSVAFQAGYTALMAVLSSQEVGLERDHPDYALVRMAGERVMLSESDMAFGGLAALSYYAAEDDRDPAVTRTWAQTVREHVRAWLCRQA